MRLGKYLSSLTKPELDNLYEICGLTEEEVEICEMLRRRLSRTKISEKTIMSIRTLQRRMKEIENKINRAKELNLRDD